MSELRSRPTRSFATVLLVGTLLAACGSNDSTSSGSGGSQGAAPIEVVIGDLNSLTGPFAGVGTPGSGSIKTAADEINKQGGFVVNGQKYTLKVVTVDTTSQAQQAGAGATQLLRDNGAKFVFGPSETATAVAAQPIVTKANALFFSTAYIVSDNLQANGVSSPPGSVSFAVGLGNDTAVAAGIDGLMKLHPDIKTAVGMYPNLASYDASINTIQSTFAKYGVSDTSVRFDASTTDFSAILTKIKTENHPDAIFVGPSSAIITPLAKQMAGLGGVAKYLYGSGGQASIATKDAVGGPLPFPFEYITPGGMDPALNDPKVQAYITEYTAVNGPPPASQIGFTNFYYASVKALVKAMQQAGSVDDTSKIAAALTQVSAPSVVGNDFSFNAQHRAKIPAAFCEVTSGNTSCQLVYPVS